MCSQIVETFMHANVICDVTARYQESEHSATLAERRQPLLVTVGSSEWELLPSDRDWKYEKACFFKSRKAFQAEASDPKRQKLLVSFFLGSANSQKLVCGLDADGHTGANRCLEFGDSPRPIPTRPCAGIFFTIWATREAPINKYVGFPNKYV